MDVEDSRFKAIFENPMFNIDPSAPQFKKTKAMDSIISEKAKRRKRKHSDVNRDTSGNNSQGVRPAVTSEPKKANTDVALASLVKSVKTKTKSLHAKKAKHHHS